MAFALPLIGAAAAGGGAAAAGGSLATALSVGASALTGIAGLSSGLYQAGVARNNAALAERNAQVASQKVQMEQIQSDRETAQALGIQEAEQGASGVNLMSRSFLESRKNTQRIGREQARNIYDAGLGKAKEFQQEAANFRGEASNATSSAISNAVGGVLSAGSAIYDDPTLRRSIIGSARPTKKSFTTPTKEQRARYPNVNWFGRG